MPRTFDEAEALYKEAGKVLGNPKVGTPLDHANLIEHEAKKVAPTSTEQLPVVITEERRNVKELTLFEVGLLPFLYLEAAVKYVFNYINKRYPLK